MIILALISGSETMRSLRNVLSYIEQNSYFRKSDVVRFTRSISCRKNIFRVGQTGRLQTHVHNSVKSQPIHESVSLEDFLVNLQ